MAAAPSPKRSRHFLDKPSDKEQSVPPAAAAAPTPTRAIFPFWLSSVGNHATGTASGSREGGVRAPSTSQDRHAATSGGLASSGELPSFRSAVESVDVEYAVGIPPTSSARSSDPMSRNRQSNVASKRAQEEDSFSGATPSVNTLFREPSRAGSAPFLSQQHSMPLPASSKCTSLLQRMSQRGILPAAMASVAPTLPRASTSTKGSAYQESVRSMPDIRGHSASAASSRSAPSMQRLQANCITPIPDQTAVFQIVHPPKYDSLIRPITEVDPIEVDPDDDALMSPSSRVTDGWRPDRETLDRAICAMKLLQRKPGHHLPPEAVGSSERLKQYQQRLKSSGSPGTDDAATHMGAVSAWKPRLRQDAGREAASSSVADPARARRSLSFLIGKHRAAVGGFPSAQVAKLPRKKRRSFVAKACRRDRDIALVVKKPWIDLILAGKKTWEIRGVNTNVRRVVALAESGTKTLVGEARLVRVHGPYSRPEELVNHVEMHRIRDLSIVKYRQIYAWEFQDAKRYSQPQPYDHPIGAITWVKLKLDARESAEAIPMEDSGGPHEEPQPATPPLLGSCEEDF